jgi:hypothetical protein
MSEESKVPETGDEPSKIASPAISLHINTVFGILDNWLEANNLYEGQSIHWRVTWDRNGYPISLMGFTDDEIEKLEAED